MSYKDLEAEIKAWAHLEAYAHQQKEDAKEAKRAAKRQKREQKLTGKGSGPLIPKRPAPALEKPLKTFKRITVECREIHHRTWGEIIELTFEVETISETEAEVGAIKQARAKGYSYERTVSVTTFKK